MLYDVLDISCKYRKSTDVKLKISFINIHSSQICRTAACTPGMCEFRGICHSNIILLITFSIIIFKSQLCCVVGALETKKKSKQARGATQETVSYYYYYSTLSLTFIRAGYSNGCMKSRTYPNFGFHVWVMALNSN